MHVGTDGDRGMNDSRRDDPNVSRSNRGEDADNRAVVGLLGPGRVGSRLLARLAGLRPPGIRLHAVARRGAAVVECEAINPARWREAFDGAGCADPGAWTERLAALPGRRRVIVDTTASRAVAEKHRDWLARGFGVVTANKWAAAAPLPEFEALCSARSGSAAGYHHSTTVAAGLPVIETLERMSAAGERVRRIRAVLSGTLTELVCACRAGRRLADGVIELHKRGWTEPDPAADLAGHDVARKLVIMARAAGFSIDSGDVRVQGLLPDGLASCPDPAAVGERLQARWDAIAPAGPCAFVAEFEPGSHATVGLQSLDSDDPFAKLRGAGNRIEIFSDTYHDRPLVIEGIGAGPEATAMQLLADLLRAAHRGGDPLIDRQVRSFSIA